METLENEISSMRDLLREAKKELKKRDNEKVLLFFNSQTIVKFKIKPYLKTFLGRFRNFLLYPNDNWNPRQTKPSSIRA